MHSLIPFPNSQKTKLVSAPSYNGGKVVSLALVFMAGFWVALIMVLFH